MKRPLLLILLSLVLPAHAQAAAFYLQEQSASGMGTAFAGAAADTPDVSTIFYNPAGLTDLENRPHVQAGAHVLLPRSKFTDTGTTVRTAATAGASVPLQSGASGNPYDPAVVPNLYAAYPATTDGRVWVGIGVTAPFGLANKYKGDYAARYDSTETELQTVNIAPSVAWKPTEWLSVGAGVDIQHADASLENAIPNPTSGGAQTAALEGYQNLSGDDVSVGYNIGAIVKPAPGTRVGVHYRSAISHDVRGRLLLKTPAAAGGAVQRLGGTAQLDLPSIASVGVSQQVGDWTLLGGVSYHTWSNFDDLPVQFDNGLSTRTVENYDDTWSFAAGARYQANEKLQLKAGVQFDQTPTQDGFRSTKTPDGDRIWVAGGASYKLNDRVCIDFGCAYVDVAEEDIDLTRSFPTLGGSVANIRGKTGGEVGIISTAINAKF